MAADAEDSRAAAVRDGKRLMRLSRTGALATLGADGAPLTTWVGCASDFDGSPLFLMSTLARHTQDLARDARASLLLTSPADRGDPLNRPRLTLGGTIAPDPDAYARKRYLQRNPKAKLYASFADFAVYRLRIETVHFNGGFGRADKLAPADLLSPPGDAAALIAAEDALLAELAADDRLVAQREGGRGVCRAVGLDPEGLDLSASGAAARVDFVAPAFAPDLWRRRLAEALAGPRA